MWEYYEFKPGLKTLNNKTFVIDTLNDLGGQGWELVSIINSSTYILKRPKV